MYYKDITSLFRFCLYCTTFYINGHGASVWCHHTVRHIWGYNQHTLPEWQQIWVYYKDITSLFQISKFFRLKTGWPATVATTFYKNGHVASVWRHYSVRHMWRHNRHNLPDWQRIWVYRKDITSLLRFWIFLLLNWRATTASTFLINSHGACVLCHDIFMRMWAYTHHNLPDWQLIWVYYKDITSLFQISSILSVQNWQFTVATTLFINGHGASVWCHPSIRRMMGYNQHNLPDWQHIWVYYNDIILLFQVSTIPCQCKTGNSLLPWLFQ